MLKTKRCPKCGETKTHEDFYYDRKRAGPSGWCKKCSGAAVQKRYRENRESRLVYARNHWLMTNYGITNEEYEARHAAQGGVCAFCHKPEKSKRRLHVDHCHQTGRIRGLLCAPCNSSLGVLGDTVESIERVLAYVRGNE